jgi:hypothetical protein
LCLWCPQQKRNRQHSAMDRVMEAFRACTHKSALPTRSALPSEADIRVTRRHVRFGPSNGGHDRGSSPISIANTARASVTPIATVARIIFFVSLIGISSPIKTTGTVVEALYHPRCAAGGEACLR